MLRLALVLGVSFLMVAWIAGLLGLSVQPPEGTKTVFFYSLGLAAVSFGSGLILRAFGICLLDQGSRSVYARGRH